MDNSAGEDINLEKLVAMRHGASYVRNPQSIRNNSNAGTSTDTTNNRSNHTLSSCISGSAGDALESSLAIDDGHARGASAAVANASHNSCNNTNNNITATPAPFQRQSTPRQPGAFHRQGPRVYSRGKGSLTAHDTQQLRPTETNTHSLTSQGQTTPAGCESIQPTRNHDRLNSNCSGVRNQNGDDDCDNDDDVDSDIGSTTQQLDHDSGEAVEQSALDSSRENDDDETSEARPRPPTWIHMPDEVPPTSGDNKTDEGISSQQIDNLDLEKMLIARHGTSIVRNSVIVPPDTAASANLEQSQNQTSSVGVGGGTEIGVEQYPAVGVPVRDEKESTFSSRDCAVGISVSELASTAVASAMARGTMNRSASSTKKTKVVRAHSNSTSVDISAKSMDASADSVISAKRAALLPSMLEHQRNAEVVERQGEEQSRPSGPLDNNPENNTFPDIEEGGDDYDEVSMAQSSSGNTRQLGDTASTRNLVRAREVTGESIQDLVLGAATPMNPIGEREEIKGGRLAVFLSKRVMIGAFLILCVVVVTVVLAVNRGETKTVLKTQAPTSRPTEAPTVAASASVLLDLPESTLQAIVTDKTSPQALAYQWLLEDPRWMQYDQARLLQRFVLATLYFSTNEPIRNQSHWKIDSHWLSMDHHECSWGYRGEEDVIEPCMDLFTQTKSDSIQNILLVNNGLKGTGKYT